MFNFLIILLILSNYSFTKKYNWDNVPLKTNTIEKKSIDTNDDFVNFFKFKNNLKEYFNDTNIYDLEQDSNIKTRQLSNASYLYKNNVNKVVLVAVYEDDKIVGIGSGIIVDNKEILTNKHVVDGYENAKIVLYDAKTTTMNQIKDDNIYDATVYALDSSRDLALLKTKEYLSNKVTFGNNWEISIAEDVFAIGHPKNNIWSFTYGVISGLPSPYEWIYEDENEYKANCIQTQTPINPGNSGGPLFNDRGHVIGINSFGYSGTAGLNFAVRIDEIKDFLEKAKKGIYPKGEKKEKKEAEWILIKDHSFPDIDELYGKDTNEDGEYDYWFLYEDKDDIVDIRIFDLDYNSSPDMIHDVKNNQYIIDSDFDGIWDTVGHDSDEDWWPDTFEDYRE